MLTTQAASFLRHGPFDIQGGGGGLGFFFEKNFLALILAKKNNPAQWHSEKNYLSPIVTQNSLIGMFEMSKSKKKCLARSARQRNIKFKLYLYAIA